MRDAADFVELCQLWGHQAEEHIVQTKDGYLLGLHRLQWRRGEEGRRVNSGPNSIKKRVIYLHHGLLMNSEVWVCQTDEKRCLAFELAERGFDVWVRMQQDPERSAFTDCSSLATIAETSTPKSLFTAHLTPPASGTFPSMSLLFMISLIVSSTSWILLNKKVSHILASHKEPPKPLRRSPFTPSLTTKSMSSSL